MLAPRAAQNASKRFQSNAMRRILAAAPYSVKTFGARRDSAR
jgi:hypothetical protein